MGSQLHSHTFNHTPLLVSDTSNLTAAGGGVGVWKAQCSPIHMDCMLPNTMLQVVLLGAVDRMFSNTAASQASSSGSMWGGLLLTFMYLFVTSLCMGVATGLGIAFLMKRLEGQGVHQVCMHGFAKVGMRCVCVYVCGGVHARAHVP
eukprot:307429-Pelagomonas_calceolata.AAC.1